VQLGTFVVKFELFARIAIVGRAGQFWFVSIDLNWFASGFSIRDCLEGFWAASVDL
jgi:hypothetical protein